MIVISHLDFEYPEFRALTDISVQIPKASITALVGPNGAGKTTLIRCMAALTRPSAGRVVVDGMDVHEKPRESHKLMGYLPDFFGVYEELSVRQCLIHQATAQGLASDKQPEAIQWAAAQLGLTDRMEQPAGTLSRGLRQRLAIAQTIVHRPKVILLDEPASGLDPEARMELGRLIRQLGQEGMTIIVSSHILAELSDYSTHMMILRDGRLVDYQPIDGISSEGLTLLRLELARPIDDLAGRIGAALPDGRDIRIEEDRLAMFTVPESRARDEALLKALMGADLPVIAIGPMTRNIQESYLERLRTAPQSPEAGGGS